jgi:hypothetical protein
MIKRFSELTTPSFGTTAGQGLTGNCLNWNRRLHIESPYLCLPSSPKQ